MKPTTFAACTLIASLFAGFPVCAGPLDAEMAELQAMQKELDQEQVRLDQRRQELELRRLQLELRAKGRDAQDNPQLAPKDKAAKLAKLQAQAHAEKSRGLWISEWQTASASIRPNDAGERRMGAPKAFGKRAKELEAKNEILEKQTKLRLRELEDMTLTSMQTSLADHGSLNDSEFKWLESLVAEQPEGSPPITDDATIARAKVILEMEKERRDPANAPARKPAPAKKGPLFVE